MTKTEKIAIAEKRIAECEERRRYFAAQVEAQPEHRELYIGMCESETAMIEEIRDAIIKALLSK